MVAMNRSANTEVVRVGKTSQGLFQNTYISQSFMMYSREYISSLTLRRSSDLKSVRRLFMKDFAIFYSCLPVGGL